MKKNILIPVVLLATTPFVVACTKKPTDMPPPPPVTGETETVAPAPTDTTSAMPSIEVDATAVVSSGGTVEVSASTTTPAMPVTRTETVTYASPANPQDPVEFSVTVTDGIITAASATPKSDHEISKKLQTAFAAEVGAKVVGMKAADLDVDAIGGASLTTGAFETFVRSF